MATLSLVNPERGDITVKISKFPDGQQAAQITSDVFGKDTAIESRLNSWKDLELIVGANQALLEAGAQSVSLYVPYFLGARSDRKFLEGTSNYLKTVICPVINSQKFAGVIVMDPHSDVLEACLDNFHKIDNVDLVKFALEDLVETGLIPRLQEILIISPDAGALKKIYHVAESTDYKKQIIIASKHRDIETGKILSTEVPGIDQDLGQKGFVIIDDICDGGRTFIEIAKAIRSIRSKSIFNDKIILIVTHGIFSAGFYELGKWFDAIYCTNSIKDIPASVTEIVLFEDGISGDSLVKTNVTQFNIF